MCEVSSVVVVLVLLLLLLLLLPLLASFQKRERLNQCRHGATAFKAAVLLGRHVCFNPGSKVLDAYASPDAVENAADADRSGAVQFPLRFGLLLLVALLPLE